jgi:hypothetical protein
MKNSHGSAGNRVVVWGEEWRYSALPDSFSVADFWTIFKDDVNGFLPPIGNMLHEQDVRMDLDSRI